MTLLSDSESEDNLIAESIEDIDRFADEITDHTSQAAKQAPPKLSREPLFAILLREAIDPHDAVLADYANYVAPRLSALLGHVTAKGGNFAVIKREAGAPAEEVARYGDDQSMRAHILNGLLPTAQIARTLRDWGARRFTDEFDDETYRLFCAGYTLHDWLKLPDVDQALRAIGLQHHTVNVAVHLADVERIIGGWCERLGLDEFLRPLGGIEPTLHDLIYIATNTQLQWGVMHNLSALPGLRARGRKLLLATHLATLADYLAYLGRTPIDVVQHPSIIRMFEQFRDTHVQARLTYHHLSDVRGVITSIINNAAIAAYGAPGLREPLLYAPTGVVYLERGGAPPAPSAEQVAGTTITRIRDLCQRQLSENLTGLSRDGKGIKYADYYTLFFTPRELARLIARFAERRIGKTPTAGKRYGSIQAKSMAPPDIDLDLPDEATVDRIAETCALLVKIAAEYAPEVDAETLLLDAMGQVELRPVVRQINSNRTAGGVPYGWYYAVGTYRRATPGLDEQQWIDRLHALTEHIAERLPDTPPTDAAGWAELRRYVVDHLHFADTQPTDALHQRLQTELSRYTSTRKSGRGRTVVCTLCSSSYAVNEQRDAAVLFQPTLYTNKRPLHDSNTVRHICAICGAEMMLRQLLMKRGGQTGGNFEKRKLRYLFFYPTYFFTPETLRVVRKLHDRLKSVSFTSLRNLLVPRADQPDARIDLAPERYQQLEELMLHPAEFTRVEDDRLFRLHFASNEPITFAFIGLPPPPEAKDAEAWVNPAFLALTLPLLLDVKIVASESLMPIIQEATELPETVAFDAPHAFVTRMTGGARLNLDEVLPALQRLNASYLIHLEGNAKSGAGGFDYRWNELPAVARNLASSPLYAFHYLKKGLRRDSGDLLPAGKAALYLELVERYLENGRMSMSHARDLVLLYRHFYRHKAGRLNSNSILRPLSEAADVLLQADPRLFADDSALIEAVQGRLEKFVENVRRDAADGRIPGWIDAELRQAKLEEFSRYVVESIYRKAFGGDRAALAGKQLNLLKNACEAIYLAEQRREWRERGQSHDDEPQNETTE